MIQIIFYYYLQQTIFLSFRVKDFTLPKDLGCIVDSDGTVTLDIQAILNTSCRINAQKFPFDTQHCTIRFAPWYHNGIVNITTLDQQFTTLPHGEYFIENGVWELDGIGAESLAVTYADVHDVE